MLTDMQCKAAKAKDKVYRINDFQGLYLEIKPTGVKYWRYRFKIQGKDSLFTIGGYPDVSLAEARQITDESRKLVKQGISPVQNRVVLKAKQIEAGQNTFEVVTAEWLALKDWEQVTKDKTLQMLKRAVFPHIGKLPIAQITPLHLLNLIKGIHDNGAPSVAEHARRVISAVCDFAVCTLRAETNPAYPIRQALPKNKTQHKTALSKEEIAQLMHDFDGDIANLQTKCAFKFMWLTLARPGEAVGARWDEINFETATWTVKAERMKKRKSHTVPLPTQAIELLKQMQVLNGNTPFVFPHRDNRRTQAMTYHAFRQTLHKTGWSGKFSPHATRTTGSTMLNEMGYRGDIIEAQLAHTEPNAVRRTYNHAMYLEERREMMQKWADWLGKTSKEIANV